jgi:ubiquitin-conjugating enzyme E2 variant
MKPVHYEISRAQYAFSAGSIVAAVTGLAAVATRLILREDVWAWWTPVSLVAGAIAADLGSGLVHWAADTWGRDDLPLIGHRLLVPFRVHHLNPDDFLRRSFVDTNGEVAFVAAVVLAGLLMVPLEASWARPLAMFGCSFCGIGMMTNQIHQWAHMPSPPRPVRRLQDAGLILGPRAHATHHDHPYDAHYCITTGWCNRPLEAVGFFRGLERAITRVTGARPRHDDERYEQRYGRGTPFFAAND